LSRVQDIHPPLWLWDRTTKRVHDGDGVVLGLRAARPETAPAPGR